jgi:hypothetical protein
LPVETAGLRPVESLPDSTRLNLSVSLPLRNQPALTSLLQQIYDPGSPNYHRYLTPADFARQFGPSEQDYEDLIAFARTNQLKITHTHPNRTLLDISASVADIRRVLHTDIKVYQHPSEGRIFYAPEDDPSVPENSSILEIKGLDNYYLPRSNLKSASLPSSSSAVPLAGSGPNGTYLGNDFRVAYAPGVSLTGAGQSVALVEFDGYYPADIAKYESLANLPAITLTNVSVDGTSGEPGKNNQEVALDIEMLASIAPGLTQILVYEALDGLETDDMLNQIATDNAASQISCSWDFTTVDAVTDQILQQFAAQGQSFFCSSGDSGAYASGAVPLPADDPYVTVVGGTVLATDGPGGAWQSESVWKGSGGGFSTNYPIPTWQAGVNMTTNQGSQAYRNWPDVAMCGTNVVAVYNNGKTNATWGTSIAAPLWAGFTALVNQQSAQYGDAPVGFLNPSIYAIAEGSGYATTFHDITMGSNVNSSSPHAYFAVPGYDLCSGWGTPAGSNLINALAQPDTLAILPVPGFSSTGPGGGPFSVTSESFSLTNDSSASLNWSAGTDAAWLSALPASGSLDPAMTNTLEVGFNAAASNLPVGTYTAHLTLTNLSNGLLHHRTFTLQVSDPLTFSPAFGFEFGGAQSGPFNVAAQTCEISNASDATVTWSLVTNPAWLNISPTSGAVGPSGTAEINCSLNSGATNMPSGAYSADILFSNNTFAAQESLPVLFLVGQLVQNGGFETGDFTGWTLTGNTFATIETNDPTVVHSGEYGVALAAPGELGYLSQEIPTVPGQSYLLSLWLDSPDGMMTNEFSVSWGGDTLFDYTNLPAIGWTNLQFVVVASNSETLLEMGYRDDPSYLGLDDISVTAGPPSLWSVTPSTGPVAGGTTVTLYGNGFQGHAAVSFGSIPAASVIFNSATNLTVVTPAFADVGAVDVTITNADGQIAMLLNGFQFVGTPVITWANPAAVTYGTGLGASQLDPSANLTGVFSFSPPAGTVLNAGTNVLSAAFAPSDSTDYYSVTDYVNLVVSPAPLSVTASNFTRPYGLNNPVFTGSLVGLVNGDTITATYNCAATSSSPAEDYLIVPKLSDPDDRLPNYQVSTTDGILTILAPVSPMFQTPSVSADSITFSWSATIGAAYQVQHNLDLAAGNWTDLSGPITASNATVGFTNAVTNARSFYRVLQVPQ